MKRREFIAGLSAAGWPLLVRAQQQTKPVIVWLEQNPVGTPPDFFEPFRRGLAEFGFSEGRDVTVEFHNIAGYGERLPALVADVVRRRPVAIIAIGVGAASAAKAATGDIPIIFFSGIDPVELGLVPSFKRPGGNLTGIALLNTDTAEKRLELLHTAVPAVEVIALLVGPAGSLFDQAEARDMQSAARILGLHLLIFNLTVDTEIAPVFAKLVEHRAGAVLVGGNITVSAKYDQIQAHALRFALPTMFAYSIAARAGGLLTYGPDVTEDAHQLGAYTGRILKGEKPADLPVIRSNKFEFVVNLKTGKALGLNLPPTLLAIADEVIE
jgi:putative tryptophan/tyrosine transport system substrate-binding protein